MTDTKAPAVLYKVNEDGSEEALLITPANGESFTLEELQGFVEGNGSNTIQYLPLPDGRVMFANDNGRLVGLPVNGLASKAWREAFPEDQYQMNRGDMTIVGNAVVCSSKQAGEEE